MQSFITNDLSFAAYLLMHDVAPVDVKKLGRTFKFTYIHTEQIDKLRLSYPVSESSKHDDCVRKLKKLVYGDDFRD